MGIFKILFGKKKISLEEANEKNKKYLSENPKPKNDKDGLLREASSALTNGEFEKSIELYKKMERDFPEDKGLYLSQIGAAYYFLEDLNKAIEYYLLARNNGAHPDMIEYNIWEACETMYKKDGDKNAIERYLEYLPKMGVTLKKQKRY